MKLTWPMVSFMINSLIRPFIHLTKKSFEFLGQMGVALILCYLMLYCLILCAYHELINTSYLTDSYISFAPTGLLGQVHIVKKLFLKFLHAGAIFL